MFVQNPKVMVWCAVTSEKDIVPYFFGDCNVNGEKYRNMLIHYEFPRFATLRQGYIFQRDGAPTHYSSRVRNYLDNKRPNNWIGRGGPVDWHARPPDFLPPDLFLWVHIKSKVYDTPIYTI